MHALRGSVVASTCTWLIVSTLTVIRARASAGTLGGLGLFVQENKYRGGRSHSWGWRWLYWLVLFRRTLLHLWALCFHLQKHKGSDCNWKENLELTVAKNSKLRNLEIINVHLVFLISLTLRIMVAERLKNKEFCYTEIWGRFSLAIGPGLVLVWKTANKKVKETQMKVRKLRKDQENTQRKRHKKMRSKGKKNETLEK